MYVCMRRKCCKGRCLTNNLMVMLKENLQSGDKKNEDMGK